MAKYRRNIQIILTKLVLSVLVFSLAVVQPAGIAIATEDATTTTPTTNTTTELQSPTEEASPVLATTNTGPQTIPGPTSPTGADSNTYTENPATGNWENDHYIWDPVTHQTRPKQLPDYSYDPATGTWSTNDWTFDPATGKYIPTPQPVPADLLAALGLLPGGTRANINGTGPNSNNQINSNDTANGIFNLYTKTEINNYFGLYSLTGDALVNGNTQGGNASSGDASALANIINLLNSAWRVSGGKMLTFIQNLFGDVDGDIVLDTGSVDTAEKATKDGSEYGIQNTGPNSNNTINDNDNGKIDINTAEYNDINNNLVLNAKSGNAAVNGNTKGGSAKSGDARVLLNLLNIINSTINSGKSFFGVLNIYGNLNGDILFSKDFLDQLIQNSEPTVSGGNNSYINNTGPNSNNTIDSPRSTNLTSNTNDISTINNNIRTSAKSGLADVSNNTNAGNATTGNTNSKLTLLNLTGKQVIARNAVLVFVNVFGRWVGLIMDAPAGTKSAIVGGGVKNNNSSSPGVSIDSTSATTNTINNNIDLSAESGNATVNGNTEAGDATSGDADIAANVGNIVNSDLSLSDWFGVLFINVFGDWLGSFGVDTPAGNSSTQQNIVGNSFVGDVAQHFAASQTVDNLLKTNSQFNASSPVSIDSGSSKNILTSISPNSTIANQLDYKKPSSRPFSDYAFPLFAIIAVSVAGVIFQLSKKYSK